MARTVPCAVLKFSAVHKGRIINATSPAYIVMRVLWPWGGGQPKQREGQHSGLRC